MAEVSLPFLRHATLTLGGPSLFTDWLIDTALSAQLVSLQLRCPLPENQWLQSKHSTEKLRKFVCNAGGWRRVVTTACQLPALRFLCVALCDDRHEGAELVVHQIGQMIPRVSQLHTLRVTGCWDNEVSSNLLSSLLPMPREMPHLRHLDFTGRSSQSAFLATHSRSSLLGDISDKIDAQALRTLCVQAADLAQLIKFFKRLANRQIVKNDAYDDGAQNNGMHVSDATPEHPPRLESLCIQRLSSSVASSFTAAEQLQEVCALLDASPVRHFYVGLLEGSLQGLEMSTFMTQLDWQRMTEGIHSHFDKGTKTMWRPVAQFYWSKAEWELNGN